MENKAIYSLLPRAQGLAEGLLGGFEDFGDEVNLDRVCDTLSEIIKLLKESREILTAEKEYQP